MFYVRLPTALARTLARADAALAALRTVGNVAAASVLLALATTTTSSTNCCYEANC